MSELDAAVNKRDEATKEVRSKMSELDAMVINRDKAQKELEEIIYKMHKPILGHENPVE